MTSEDIDKNSNFIDQPRDEVIINTDRQALNNSPVPNRVLIGRDGLGAGNDPEVARLAAEEIAKLFDDETKMVFITAGMGGGTSTGAVPVVARIAQKKGMLMIGIVTIPFLFEGQKKILKALDGAEEMSNDIGAILVVNNEQLTEIYSDLNWMNAFGKADDTLTNAARSISELITSDGYTNLDFKDVNTILKDGDAAIISTGYGEGEHRVTKAINDALHSPLLKNRDIFGWKRLLVNLCFSRNVDPEFAMGEAAELTSFINNLDPDVDVIYGICFDDTLGNKIKINILAQIEYAGMKASDLPGGIIIVGGGARLHGFNDLLSKQGKMKVRMDFIQGPIRISDGAIHPETNLDVISILLAASRLLAVSRLPEAACVVFPASENEDSRDAEGKDDYESMYDGEDGDENESRVGRGYDEEDSPRKRPKKKARHSDDFGEEIDPQDDEPGRGSRGSLFESLRSRLGRISTIFTEETDDSFKD